MDRTAVDTNVVVAGLLSWHEHHDRALPMLRATLAAESGLILAFPVLIESYSVMTRLPPPFRITPRDAHKLLRLAFTDNTTIVSVPAMESWNFMDDLPAAGVSGGATYNAHILACAKSGGAIRLATFNKRHFQNLELGDLQLVTP